MRPVDPPKEIGVSPCTRQIPDLHEGARRRLCASVNPTHQPAPTPKLQTVRVATAVYATAAARGTPTAGLATFACLIPFSCMRGQLLTTMLTDRR